MAEALYGPWLLEVKFGITQANERFTITGSDSSDGVYTKRELEAGIKEPPGVVSGQEWSITIEYSPFGFLDIGMIGNFVSGQWYLSGIRRGASYTLKDDPVITLTADYFESSEYSGRFDYKERALILACENLDPSLRPGPPILSPYDFTLPREMYFKYWRKKAKSAQRIRPK